MPTPNWRALRMKDEFLANMSHELRTPLHGILAVTETLLDQIRGPLNERQQKSVGLIEKSGRHLLALINDLLDLSRIEAGKLELHCTAVSVDDVCRSSLLFVRGWQPRKRSGSNMLHPCPACRSSPTNSDSSRCSSTCSVTPSSSPPTAVT